MKQFPWRRTFSTWELASHLESLLPSTVMATPGKSARNSRSASEPALLTSRDNRWLKEFRVALRGGLPTESGFVGVEGVRLVEEALRSGCRIQAVLFSESGERHHERLSSFIDRPEMAFSVLRTTDRLFEGLADTEHPQGVAALVHPRETSFDEFVHAPLSACAPLLVVLAGVQDPGNVGSILRTAAALGATGAATAASGISGTANPFSPKALRASAGAALHLPILAGMSLSILLAQLKVAGVRTLATSVRENASVLPDVGARLSASPSVDAASQPLAPWEVDWCQPVALLVGNEGSGLPEEIESSADARIRIPMASGVESLNAAAAAAVVFYEAARQRNSHSIVGPAF
ncbi:MAG TPA: RNA methyltransferase [Candidatus Acidoferrum sp.]|nr:RNA methyltransferase [Candidatus Acidoferrum sp.]